MDNGSDGRLLRIGTFSHVGRVSARLLRHYHAIRLLVPAVIDDDNGYRFYDVAQLGDLHRILALRDLGLSLEDVREVMAGGLTVHELRGRLTELEAEATAERDRTEARLRSIRARVAALDGGYDEEPLQHQSFEPTSVRSITGTFTPTEARQVVRVLFEYGTHRGFEPPFIIARWTGPYEPEQFSLEIALQVPPGGHDRFDEPVELADSVLPAGSFITTVRTMAADAAHELYAAVPAHCRARGLRLNGALREVVYAMPPADSADEPTVEVQFGVD